MTLGKGERALTIVPLPVAGVEDPDDPGFALATASGVVKRVVPEPLGNRPEVEVIALKDLTARQKDEVVAATALTTGQEDLVFVTTDAQLLRFSAALVRPQGRGAAGMAGIKLSPGARVVAMTAVAAGRHRRGGRHGRRGRGGGASQVGSAKVTPLSEYPSKGRATGGVRCHRFARGEDSLLLAWAGRGPAEAATSTGSAVALPAAGPPRRVGHRARQARGGRRRSARHELRSRPPCVPGGERHRGRHDGVPLRQLGPAVVGPLDDDELGPVAEDVVVEVAAGAPERDEVVGPVQQQGRAAPARGPGPRVPARASSRSAGPSRCPRKSKNPCPSRTSSGLPCRVPPRTSSANTAAVDHIVTERIPAGRSAATTEATTDPRLMPTRCRSCASTPGSAATTSRTRRESSTSCVTVVSKNSPSLSPCPARSNATTPVPRRRGGGRA